MDDSIKKQMEVHAQNIARIIAAIYTNSQYPPKSTVDEAIERYWTEYREIIREAEKHANATRPR